jgi:hypothetical protein
MPGAGTSGKPVVFGWQNVGAFVDAIQEAQTQALASGVPLPVDPLDLPAVVNVQNFKEAVLEYTRGQGTAARLDTVCLPCSSEQLDQVKVRLNRLDGNPWIQRVIDVARPNALPIACVYVPRPRSDTLDKVTHHLPNSLWG